jgi:hypothetical protein
MTLPSDMPEWAKLTPEELGTWCVVCQHGVPLGQAHPHHTESEVAAAYAEMERLFNPFGLPVAIGRTHPNCRCVIVPHWKVK